MKKIYLDNAATTPVDPCVVQTMLPYFTEIFGNASSPHGFGQEARKAMDDARSMLANFIGADPAEIVFTSSATEANNFAIFGTAQAMADRGKHIIVSSIEHHAVFEPVEQLAKQGYEVTQINVSPNDGVVDVDAIRDVIREDTILIAVIHANNEIGTIQPVNEIGALAQEKNIPFLVDAVQSVGHILVDVNDIKCDLLSLSAHKFYGPKGVGALYIRRGFKPKKYLWGGDQERERRASTQNIPGIVGLGKAVKLCAEQMNDEEKIQISWRDQLINKVLKNIDGTILNGHPRQRLPNNINMSFDDIKGEDLITALDMEGMAVSMGSACTSGALEPSHVLKAIGRTKEQAFGALRISLGRFNTQEDIERFSDALIQKVKLLRK